MADQPPPPTEAELAARDHFVGSSEGEEATISIWPNALDEISVWLEEDYRKEGQPGLFSMEALCSLPRPVAAALGRRLRDLAGGDPPDAELVALRRFRDAIDAASVAYHAGAAVPVFALRLAGDGAPTLPLVFLRLERAVAIALTEVQDALDVLDGRTDGR